MNLIYLCPKSSTAIGGIKVIYQHVNIMNRILPIGSKAEVFHPNTILYRGKCFNIDTPQKRAFLKPRITNKLSFSSLHNIFNPANDIVIAPEVWAYKYATQLKQMKVPYIIFAQNGYLMSKGPYSTLSEIYSHAVCILTISDDVTRCVKTAFPNIKDNIFRIHCSINVDLFKPANIKENLITYMPRKLRHHTELVRFFLRHIFQKIGKLNQLMA